MGEGQGKNDGKSFEDEEKGEGNRAADKQYRERTERFIKQGGVEPAADEARRAMKDDEQREELERAEETGRSHIAEEDPALKRR